jgi:hypothetical protein
MTKPDRPENGMEKGATLSDCGRYRYELWRSWDASLPQLAFVGLNPSTADAQEDDATVRRLVRFARDNGCGSLFMVNLFAYRATDPKDLASCPDPIGPDNDTYLDEVWYFAALRRLVLGWGSVKFSRARAKAVLDSARDKKHRGVRLMDVECFGLNKDGAPVHPLYLPATTPLVKFRL